MQPVSKLFWMLYGCTAEGDQRGPTLNFRGLDNASYYRLSEDPPIM